MYATRISVFLSEFTSNHWIGLQFKSFLDDWPNEKNRIVRYDDNISAMDDKNNQGACQRQRRKYEEIS